MNPIVVLVALVTVAIAAPASGHTWDGPAQYGAVGPGGHDSGQSFVGGVSCQGAGGPGSPGSCGSGYGGTVYDVTGSCGDGFTGIEEGYDNPGCNGVPSLPGHHHPYASGTCAAEASSPTVGEDFSWACGTDRNDDSLVSDALVCRIESDAVPTTRVLKPISNHDECTGQTASSANEDFADDWVYGTEANGRSNPRGFCFQDDVRGWTDIAPDDTGQDDVSAVNQAVFPPAAGDGWDSIYFFVAVPSSSGAAMGVIVTYLAVAGDDDGCGNVSADRENGATNAHISTGNDRTNEDSVGGTGTGGGSGGAAEAVAFCAFYGDPVCDP